MFGQITETPYDMRFSMFGIPIRVHPAFWILGAFIGWNAWKPAVAAHYDTNPMALLFIWLVCMFVSILVHELGHALLAKYYGWPPQIVLYHFGGLAMFQPTWGYSRTRAILIALAGPMAGFGLLGLTIAVQPLFAQYADRIPPMVLMFIGHALSHLVFINLFWGLLNLLPILPLDGGRVSEQIWDKFAKRRAMEGCLKTGVAVGILAAAYMFQSGNPYGAVLFGFLAYNNFTALQQNQQGYW